MCSCCRCSSLLYCPQSVVPNPLEHETDITGTEHHRGYLGRSHGGTIYSAGAERMDPDVRGHCGVTLTEQLAQRTNYLETLPTNVDGRVLRSATGPSEQSTIPCYIGLFTSPVLPHRLHFAAGCRIAPNHRQSEDREDCRTGTSSRLLAVRSTLTRGVRFGLLLQLRTARGSVCAGAAGGCRLLSGESTAAGVARPVSLYNAEGEKDIVRGNNPTTLVMCYQSVVKLYYELLHREGYGYMV